MTLAEQHAALRAALAPLGIDVGAEVLELWADREKHGQEPVTYGALKELAAVAGRLMREKRAA